MRSYNPLDIWEEILDCFDATDHKPRSQLVCCAFNKILLVIGLAPLAVGFNSTTMDPAIPILGYILLAIFLLLFLLLISFFLICKYQMHTERRKARANLNPRRAKGLEHGTRIPLQRGGIGSRGKELRGMFPFRRGGMGRYCDAGGGEGVERVDGVERMNGNGVRNGIDGVDVVDGDVEMLGAPPPYTLHGEV